MRQLSSMKRPIILYFVDGAAPSKEDYAEAAKLQAEVKFRNARKVSNAEVSIEQCDGVTGKVPTPYKKLPSAKQAIETYQKKVDALLAETGDTKAPKKAKAIAKTQQAVVNPPANDGKSDANPNANSNGEGGEGENKDLKTVPDWGGQPAQ